MARPFKKRTICFKLKAAHFKPHPCPEAGEVVLEVDEIEAVRLADLDGEYQQRAAEKMGISRSTFSNIIHRAHHKIAEALIKGRMIRMNCPRLVKRMKRMDAGKGF